MKTLLIATTIAAASIFAAIKAGYRNVDTTKAAAPKRWDAAGYEIKGYEGYQWSPIGGGNVWYIVTRKDSPGITYHGFLQKWGGEYHIYNLRAIDAIGPQ